MTADLFDAAAIYDEDYLHFFTASGAGGAPTHGPVVGTAYTGTSAAVDVVWRLLDLEPGMSVLDLACGHGALAGRPGYGEDGEPLNSDHHRMIVSAQLP